ncbi:MAG: hypothetical protein LBH96_05225 [Candidatus Peribacteria bacterium]|jgi:hypothetical protein|nr:hypothetical protein [Candidatus Peribacteria bacterium]
MSCGCISEEDSSEEEPLSYEVVQELDGERQDDSFFSLGVEQIGTVEDVQYIVNLIKNNPGERNAKVMGKVVSVSDYAIEAMKKFLKK